MQIKKVVSVVPFLALFATDSFAEVTLEPLPANEVLPIAGTKYSCGCISFLQNRKLAPSNVIMSTGAGDEQGVSANLIRLSGETLSLNQEGTRQEKGAFINEYSSGNVRVTTRIHEVEYRKACVSYPEPPTEGTCYLGALTLRLGKKSATAKIVTICGC